MIKMSSTVAECGCVIAITRGPVRRCDSHHLTYQRQLQQWHAATLAHRMYAHGELNRSHQGGTYAVHRLHALP